MPLIGRKLRRSLKKQKRDKERVELEKQALLKRLDENKDLRIYVERVESAALAFANKLAREAHLAQEFAFTGSSYHDFMGAISAHRKLSLMPGLMCKGKFDGGYSTHGNIEVCWSTFSERDAAITGFCDTKKRACWTRQHP
jgi:hypothetical protein